MPSRRMYGCGHYPILKRRMWFWTLIQHWDTTQKRYKRPLKVIPKSTCNVSISMGSSADDNDQEGERHTPAMRTLWQIIWSGKCTLPKSLRGTGLCMALTRTGLWSIPSTPTKEWRSLRHGQMEGRNGAREGLMWTRAVTHVGKHWLLCLRTSKERLTLDRGNWGQADLRVWGEHTPMSEWGGLGEPNAMRCKLQVDVIDEIHIRIPCRHEM